MGVCPCFCRYVLALEKCLQPKKPLWAERGEGCAAFKIKCRLPSTNASFTVRKVSYGVGVERIFPLHSPIIDRIEVISRGRVRRAKIYYLRKLRGKAARIRERRFS